MRILSRPIDVTHIPLHIINEHCPHIHIEQDGEHQRVWGYFFVIEYDDPQALVEALNE